MGLVVRSSTYSGPYDGRIRPPAPNRFRIRPFRPIMGSAARENEGKSP